MTTVVETRPSSMRWFVALTIVLLLLCAVASPIFAWQMSPGAFAEAWVLSQGVDEHTRHTGEMNLIEEGLAEALAQEQKVNIPVRERQKTLAQGIVLFSLAGFAAALGLLFTTAGAVYVWSLRQRARVVTLGNGYTLINNRAILDTNTGRVVLNELPAPESQGRITTRKAEIMADAYAAQMEQKGRAELIEVER